MLSILFKNEHECEMFVKAYARCKTAEGWTSPGKVEQADDDWIKMYVPSWGVYAKHTYKELAELILSLEDAGMGEPMWHNDDELHIWFDMHCVLSEKVS